MDEVAIFNAIIDESIVYITDVHMLEIIPYIMYG